MDLNIYNINFVVMMFGRPINVEYQANVERGIDTSGILTLDYGSFQCVCIAAKDCKAPVSASIQGDKGCIYFTSAANAIEDFKVIMNDAGPAKQMNADEGRVYDYNEGKHRMYHEFAEFVRMMDRKDFDKAEEMLTVSLISMDIQTEARNKAGIVFAADRE
ncbi:oxidoreductase [Lachnospiraceae bacterium 54-53]